MVDEARTSIPASISIATADMGAIAQQLRADGRLADQPVLHAHPLLVTVRRKDRLVVLTPATAWANQADLLAPFADSFAKAEAMLIVIGHPGTRALDDALKRGLCATVSAYPDQDELFVAVHNAFELMDARLRSETRGQWLQRYRYEIGEFAEIAHAITTEREIDKLLALILEKSRFVTDADAGSIYVVEGEDPDIGRRTLHFKLSQNDSIKFDSSAFAVPINPSSMAGYVALNRRSLNIPDVYELPPDAPYGFDRSFDETTHYRTRSMLCTPLLSRLGDVIGVIQLLNRKGTPKTTSNGGTTAVIAFDQHSEALLSMLASLAGVALENAILYAENQRMLEGFVRASVEAIEQRDPTTSGHSRRVSIMTTALADATERTERGPYRDVRWTADDMRELEYAALLHDFGKIGVREEVLVKAKKLYPKDLELLRGRFNLAARTLEVDTLKRKIDAIERGASDSDLHGLEAELKSQLEQLADSFACVLEANEPKILRGGDFSRLEKIARLTFIDRDGHQQTLLTERELESLMVPRGSLTADEFDEIRSHVSHTYEFLSTIPWGRQFRRLAAIAGAHHERLDGTGYPNRLRASEIPLQSKIMSVSDIFDALTAADRPYKRAVPLGRAIDILHMEVADNHIDEDLVRIFAEAHCWKDLPEPPKN